MRLHPQSFDYLSFPPVMSSRSILIEAAGSPLPIRYHSAVVPQWTVLYCGLTGLQQYLSDSCFLWRWLEKLFVWIEKSSRRQNKAHLNTWMSVCSCSYGSASKQAGGAGSGEDSSGRLGVTIIRLKKVMEITGLARSTIYKYIEEGTFPKPVPLGGRAVGWIEQEVFDWVVSRVEMRDSGSDLSAA